MISILNIPKHTKCKNCGKCCGPVFCTDKEKLEIEKYIQENKIKPIKSNFMTCKYRDNKNKKCLIYPVRPIICQLFGVTKGMECINGNTTEIDGEKFLEFDQNYNLL